MKNYFISGSLYSFLLGVFFCACNNSDAPEPVPATGNAEVIGIIPQSACANTEVKIYGKNFASKANENRVVINNREIIPHQVYKGDIDTLYFMVANRMGSGSISIKVNNQLISSKINFNYLSQTIISILSGCIWGESNGEEGDGNSTLEDAKYNGLRGATVDDDGNLYVVEQWTHCVRKLTLGAGAKVEVFAGQYKQNGYINEVNKLQAKFNQPKDIVYIGNNEFIVISENAIQKIANDGKIYAIGKKQDDGEAGLEGELSHVKFPGANAGCYDKTNRTLYINSSWKHIIQKIDLKTNQVSIYAGHPDEKANTDGDKNTARLIDPGRMTITPNGDLYFIQAYDGNGCLRKITPDGNVSTVAGIPGNAGYADGNGLLVQFDFAERDGGTEVGGSLCVDADGNILIADLGNYAIRKYNVSTGEVTTVNTVIINEGENRPTKWAFKDGVPNTLAHPIYITPASNNIYYILQSTGDAPGVIKLAIE